MTTDMRVVFQDIADAIREKNPGAGTMKITQFAENIRNIAGEEDCDHADVIASYTAQIAQLEKTQREQIEQINTAHEAEMEQAQSDFDNQIDRLNSTHRSEIISINNLHDGEINLLKKQQEDAITQALAEEY